MDHVDANSVVGESLGLSNADIINNVHDDHLHAALDDLATPVLDAFQETIDTGWVITDFMKWLYEQEKLAVLASCDYEDYQILISRMLFDYFELDSDTLVREQDMVNKVVCEYLKDNDISLEEAHLGKTDTKEEDKDSNV